MKKNLFPILVFLLSLPACSYQESGITEDVTVTLGVSAGSVNTKTWLDGNAGGTTLPVYWSDGDRINVNGHVSLPLAVADGDTPVRASFTVRGPRAPYSVVYPAGICDSEWTGDGALTIDLPREQEYLPSSFGNGAAVLYGYSQTEDLTLDNLCGALKISLTGDPAVEIVGASLLSYGRAISGKFLLDPSSGELEEVSGGNRIYLGVDRLGLSTTSPVSFYFTVPAGEYPEGFGIILTNSEGRPMTSRWLRMSKDADPGVTVKPGVITDFGTVEFIPEAREITSSEEWKMIAASIAGGDASWEKDYLFDGNTLRLGDDLTLEGDLTIESFPYILDAQEHSIVRTASVTPLFGTVTGEVKNLVLEGNYSGNAAPLALVLDGGTLYNVISRMICRQELTDTDFSYGGLVREVRSGILDGCINEGSVILNAKTTALKYEGNGGGIAAIVTGGNVTFRNCINKAGMSVTLEPVKGNGFVYVGFGGILGIVSSGTVSFQDCSNEASLSLETVNTAVTNQQYSIGGILGISAVMDSEGVLLENPVSVIPASVSFTGCSNSGAVSTSAVSITSSNAPVGRACAGGIAGTVFGSSGNRVVMEDCTNTGDVTPNTSFYARNAFSGVVGGLVGTGGWIDIKTCTVKAKVGTDLRPSSSVGGVMGNVLTAFSIKGCKVFADLCFVESPKYTEGNYGLAVSSHSSMNPSGFVSLGGSSISDSYFGGSLSYSRVSVYNTSDPVPAATQTAYSLENYAAAIIGSSYTGTDIALDNNNYWDGL